MMTLWHKNVLRFTVSLWVKSPGIRYTQGRVKQSFGIFDVLNRKMLLNKFRWFEKALRSYDAIVTMVRLMKLTAYIDGLVQARRNSIANALELRFSSMNPSI